MKEITLKITDKKLPFFMELVKQLGLEVVNEDVAIPAWQKEQVRQAKKELEAGTAELTEWNDLKHDLFKKYGVK